MGVMPKFPMDPETMTKECSKCGIRKAAEDFPKNNAFEFGRASECKACHNARGRKWRAMAMKERPEFRERREKSQRKARAKKYGLTLKELDSLETRSGGVCEICDNPPNMAGTSSNALNVDHCHKSGKVRGMLCSRCNLTIGVVGEDPSVLESMIAYLRRYKGEAT